MDDIEVELSTGGRLFVQCKTTLSLSSSASSEFAKVVKQLAETVLLAKEGMNFDPIKFVAVLALAVDGAQPISNLEEACRKFDFGATAAEVSMQLTATQTAALAQFRSHLETSWRALTERDLSNDDFGLVCRLFHVVRFDRTNGGADRREAVGVIGRRLFETEEDGEVVWPEVISLVREMIESGVLADRAGLLSKLAKVGITPKHAPKFDRDIHRLKTLTTEELTRLRRHSLLPGLVQPIVRDCEGALEAAFENQSFLVVGEPGAGKTGILVSIAERRLSKNLPTVFISVDRFADVNRWQALEGALELDNRFFDVLREWPGEAGVLFIDALDASRGGPAEAAFTDLIEATMNAVGDKWTIVASIRTFDLQNGRRFRQIMAGSAPDETFSLDGLGGVSHFFIKRLNPSEMTQVGQVSPAISALLATVPQDVYSLLQNVFNLSLAAQLIVDGKTPEQFTTIATQAELIQLYESDRLPTHRHRLAVKSVVSAMVERRRLIIPQHVVENDAVGEVLESGVLVPIQDQMGFAHHILFDHAAGRYFFEWSDASRLTSQISSLRDVGFLLGPGLVFALRRIWADDASGKPTSWQLGCCIGNSTGLDPVLQNVTFRALGDCVERPSDIEGLVAILASAISSQSRMFSRLARFASMSLATGGEIAPLRVEAWADLALKAATTGNGDYADGCRILLMALFPRYKAVAFEIQVKLGAAARALLELCWSTDGHEIITTNAIRFVGQSFGANPTASRALLSRAFDSDRFANYAHKEVPWIAENIGIIAKFDPEFAVLLFEWIFGRQAPSSAQTWLGGQPSRILGLTSNAGQDYDLARWNLKESFPQFLSERPIDAMRGLIRAIGGLASDDSPRLSSSEKQTIDLGGASLSIIPDTYSYEAWEQANDSMGDTAKELLSIFVGYLNTCSDQSYQAIIDVAKSEATPSSIWSRIFGIAAVRTDLNCDQLKRLIETPAFRDIFDVRRDAVRFAVSLHSRLDFAGKEAFEATLLVQTDLEGENPRASDFLVRFLSAEGRSDITLPALKKIETELGNEGRLSGNRPQMTFTRSFGGSDDVTDVLLRRSGVDLEIEPDLSIRTAQRALDEIFKAGSSGDSIRFVSVVWAAVTAVVAAIDAPTMMNPHTEILHSAWGSISNAAEAILKSDGLDVGAEGHPSLDQLVTLTSRLANNPFPETRDDNNDSLMGWGNWDVRVYAASCVLQLLRLFGAADARLVPLAQALLRDPVPTVRLQLAGSLNGLWESARGEMWMLIEQVGHEEKHLGVLGFFISGPLARLAGADTGRVEALLGGIIVDLRSSGEAAKGQQVTEGLGHLTAQLWIGEGREQAKIWVDEWAADISAGGPFLWSFISATRAALFMGFGPEAKDRDRELRERTLIAVVEIIRQSICEVKAVNACFETAVTAEERDHLSKRYAEADRLINHLVTEFYFGSGAYAEGRNREGPGLASLDAMRGYLAAYGALLDDICGVAQPATTHHLLQLFEFLSPAEPEGVFDRVARLILGTGKSTAYHYEGLAAGVLVRFVKTYLADYRSVFEDAGRRDRLIQMLELFSDAGWAEALRLLYDLPDFLR